MSEEKKKNIMSTTTGHTDSVGKDFQDNCQSDLKEKAASSYSVTMVVSIAYFPPNPELGKQL